MRFNCKLLVAAALVAGSLTMGAPKAEAVIHHFQAALTGFQEVPPRNTNAFGAATMFYDDSNQTFTLIVDVWGIQLPGGQLNMPFLRGAHHHVAPAGSNGPIVFDTGAPGTWTESPPGVIHYTVSGASMVNPIASEAALMAGNLYFNVHTNVFPGGEIRGQWCMVPEPASMIALVGGLGALALRRRRN